MKRTYFRSRGRRTMPTPAERPGSWRVLAGRLQRCSRCLCRPSAASSSVSRIAASRRASIWTDTHGNRSWCARLRPMNRFLEPFMFRRRTSVCRSRRASSLAAFVQSSARTTFRHSSSSLPRRSAARFSRSCTSFFRASTSSASCAELSCGGGTSSAGVSAPVSPSSGSGTQKPPDESGANLVFKSGQYLPFEASGRQCGCVGNRGRHRSRTRQ